MVATRLRGRASGAAASTTKAGRFLLPLSREQVQHIARLARVGLSDDDIAKFSEQLSDILDYFERLRQVETEGVPPTAHTLPLHNVWREGDQPEPPLHKEEVLANAPVRDGDYFRVKVILEE
jgi:aspartyl-tRNA(Asn)/glutamyl-tRNA(Gln) amidotransferase subunit C